MRGTAKKFSLLQIHLHSLGTGALSLSFYAEKVPIQIFHSLLYFYYLKFTRSFG